MGFRGLLGKTLCFRTKDSPKGAPRSRKKLEEIAVLLYYDALIGKNTGRAFNPPVFHWIKRFFKRSVFVKCECAAKGFLRPLFRD